MAVLLVATFPILLLIHGPVAVFALSVGITLLYRDNRKQSFAVPVPARRQQTRPRVSKTRKRH